MSQSPGSWTRWIERAAELAAGDGAARGLLVFYGKLLAAQRDVHAALDAQIGRGWRPTGSPRGDASALRAQLPALLAVVTAAGPDQLAADARTWSAAPLDTVDARLMEWWQTPADRQFLPKALLQPYARCLADAGVAPADREVVRADNRCPFCGGPPQLSILRTAASGALDHGGGRALLCATCLTIWPFRRVLCARCGEEDERKLSYFHAPSSDHVRVDACDTCRHYLKSIDLTRLGLAVPLVDEVAAAPLDLWAREQGLTKIELNLVGV
jgi:FdhE protein